MFKCVVKIKIRSMCALLAAICAHNYESGLSQNLKVALTWMKIAQSSNNNIETVDHKFLVKYNNTREISCSISL